MDKNNHRNSDGRTSNRTLVPRAVWDELMQSSSMPLLAMDQDGRVVAASPSVHAMFGVESGGLSGVRLAEKLDPRGAESLALHLDRVINRRQAGILELRFELVAHGDLLLRLNSQPDAAEQGTLSWSWVEDITAWRQSEEHASSFRRAARSALKAATVKEAGLKIMDILRAHQHIDAGCLALVDEHTGEVFYPVFEDAGMSCPEPHAPHGGLAGHLLSSGQVIWWNDLLSAGKSGGPLFGFARDPAPSDLIGIPLKFGRSVGGFLLVYKLRPGAIFNQREIELMIGIGTLLEGVAIRARGREIETALVNSVQQYPGPAMITDKHGVLEYVNPAFEKITGYDADDVMGSPVSILKSGRQSPEVYRDLWETISSGKPWRGHLVNRSKDGQLFEEDALIWPLRDKSGTIARFMAIKHVLSGDEAPAKQDAGDVDSSLFNRVVSVFIHDFRNNLLSIRMNADLISSGSRDEIRDEARQVLEASGRAEALLDNISALTAPVSRMLRDIDINQQIKRIQPLAEKLLGSKVRLRTELEPRLDLVRIPGGLIEKILTSLLFYAQRVTPAGQSLSIRTFNDQIHESDRSSFVNPPASNRFTYAVLEFSGSGLASGFHRGQAPGRAPDPDVEWTSGLPDLLIGVLGRHGSIMVRHSSGDQGVIRIYFEAVDPLVRTEKVEPVEMIGQSRATETVLVAEDDPGARRVIHRILQNQGYRVLEAENGATAVRTLMFHEGKIDLLLADVMMPDFDGKTLADQVANLQPGIKIMYVSGFDTDELERQNISLGGSAAMLVKKPFSRDELLVIVRKCLNGG